VRKFNILYIIIAFSAMLLLQNLSILRAVHEMSGDARVVNYSGLVRGATQRLVKLELSHRPDDELLGRLQAYLYGLAGNENDDNIAYMTYEPFQTSIGDLLVIWDELKQSIYDYRKGGASAEALLEVSERHFFKADEATNNAERGSEGKIKSTEMWITGGIVAISIIVVIVIVFSYLLRRSERRQMELLHEKNTQLEAAILQATEASRAKSRFLSNMSHDIRTPLNGIIGMTAIASSNLNNPGRMRDCLNKIAHSSRHLQSLVNDVLDMSIIESGKFILNAGEIDLPDFMESLVNIIQQQIKAKSQTFKTSLSDAVHKKIIGDRLRLNQLLLNILSNSVKFTPPGGIIGLDIRELPCPAEDFARFEFICYDSGIGMSEEFTRHIFESFSREQDSRIDKIEGSGLGMSITKRIVDMMGGEISVESEKNKGTKFTVVLDFPVSNIDPNSSAGPSDSAGIRLDGVRVLMAEDNALNTEIAIEMLTSAGVLLDCAADGKEALAMFNASEPGYYAVILMDMQMPVMTGCQSTAAIRKLPREDAAAIPIIAMTANAFEEDVREALDAGMNAHVAKPVDFEALKLVIGKYLPEGTFRYAADTPETSVDAGAPDAPAIEPGSLLDNLAKHGVNVADGIKRLIGNKKAYEKCLVKFVEDKNFETLSRAILEEDLPAAAQAVHALKGVSANLSMNALAEAVTDLEQALKRNDVEEAKRYFQKSKALYEELAGVIRGFSAGLK
jgi:signal transduction histidine kinase/CheY-like chemotaxis protein